MVRRRAPASIAFSTSSLTTEAGRSTTSPAAIWLARSGGSRWILVANLRFERRLRRSQPRRGDAVRRRAHIVHARLVKEVNRRRIPAVLAADADLQVLF